MIEIKNNITRISLWNNGKRFAKIESTKLYITYGYSKQNKELWKTIKFKNIEECILIINKFLLGQNDSLLGQNDSLLEKYIQFVKS